MTSQEIISRIFKIQESLQKKIVAEVARCAKKNAIENVSGKVLKVRTGHLRRYLLSKGVEFFDGQATARWGATEETGQYERQGAVAKIQELGGTIKPKNVSYLRIPLPSAQTAKGVDRFLGVELRNRKELGFFARESRAGNLILFRKLGNKSIVPMYVLKESVEIQPKHWLKKAIDDVKLEEVFNKVVKEIEK